MVKSFKINSSTNKHLKRFFLLSAMRGRKKPLKGQKKTAKKLPIFL